jgi:hypothetical protein
MAVVEGIPEDLVLLYAGYVVGVFVIGFFPEQEQGTRFVPNRTPAHVFCDVYSLNHPWFCMYYYIVVDFVLF